MSATLSAPVAELSDRELTAIIDFVYEKSGITLSPSKRALVSARLQARVRQGGFATFDQYLKHVKADASGDELTALLDAITTNHTSFFREAQHFDYVRTTVLPALMARPGGGPIRVWSAACSSGEEPYTLAMTCLDVLGDSQASRLSILASDLSTKVLRTAGRGVYAIERVEGIPTQTLRRYFEKGLGHQAGTVRVAPAVRRLIDFQQINLLEPPRMAAPFDFIFCRNVMIYFDQAVQQRVVDGLVARLAPGGYLFIAHSESLNGIRHDLQWVAPAAYRKVKA